MTLSKSIDIHKESGIYNDLLRYFRHNNHNIYVVHPREKRFKKNTELDTSEGVSYLRVKTGNVTKTSNIEKGLSMLLLEGQFIKAIKQHLTEIQFDLVIFTTPPITFARVVKYIKRKDKAQSYLLLKDIFPQNAVDLGMFGKKNPIYWFFRIKEKTLYKQADYIGCMSPANVEFIKNNNPQLSNTEIEVAPNSIEPQQITLSEADEKKIRDKYSIPGDKVIFIYGGNLGKPQGVDFIIDVLKRSDRPADAFILIVGAGTEYERLNSFFDAYKPANALLMASLPKDDYETLVHTSDVGLIFLDHRFTIPNFPSRLLSYMQASKPVLGATDNNTDLGTIVEQGEFGYWVESVNAQNFIDKMYDFMNEDKRKFMGENARRYLEKHYHVSVTYEKIMNHFK